MMSACQKLFEKLPESFLQGKQLSSPNPLLKIRGPGDEIPWSGCGGEATTYSSNGFLKVQIFDQMPAIAGWTGIVADLIKQLVHQKQAETMYLWRPQFRVRLCR